MDQLEELGKTLKDIKDYLVKCNKERRNSELGRKKTLEANEIFAKIKDVVCKLNVAIEEKKLSVKDIQSIQEKYKSLSELKNKIDEIVNVKDSVKMETFDLKTALSLIPCMDGTEDKIKQLVNAVELYESMLDEDSKKLLIRFVLKTRCSSSARLRLKENYTTIDSFILDVKTHLLTKKSDTALMTKLVNANQNSKSIECFGKELEELFVELTIAQAGDSTSAYDVLRPLNEKTAIKKFADGLRNRKLGTVIAARNYDSLKDAIRGALDEEDAVSEETYNINYIRSRGRPFQRRQEFRSNNYNRFNRFNNNYRGSHSEANRGRSVRGSFSVRGRDRSNHINHFFRD